MKLPFGAGQLIACLSRSILGGFFIAVVGLVACSIPNLEGQQCTEARETVREFYFWYLGTDSSMRAQQRDFYDRYIASNFRSAAASDLDPFFLSDSTPTTLKIGKCEMKDGSQVSMQVQLYWRQEGRTDQKEVYADVVKSGDKWLIDRVEGR